MIRSDNKNKLVSLQECTGILLNNADGKSTACVAKCSDVNMFQQQNKCVYECESGMYDANNNCIMKCTGKYLGYNSSTNMYECKNDDKVQYKYTTTINSVVYKTNNCIDLPGVYYNDGSQCTETCDEGKIQLNDSERTCVNQCAINEIKHIKDEEHYCLSDCTTLELVKQGSECVENCSQGIPVDGVCTQDCKFLVLDEGGNSFCNNSGCAESDYKYIIKQNNHQICAKECLADQGLFLDGDKCVKGCPSGKYASINQTNNIGYCVTSCLKVNGQYILYGEGQCTYACNKTTHYVINEYDENLCISRETLSDQIKYSPLAIILGSFCTLIAIIMVTVVSIGQQKRNKISRLLQ